MTAIFQAVSDIISLLPYLDLWVWLTAAAVVCAACLLIVRITSFGRR